MFAVVLALALADPHQTAQAADLEMMKCFYGQAAELDDHVSDASTIAKAVMSVCHRQFDDWKYAGYAEMKPFDATRFYAGMEGVAAGWALQTVLRVRAVAKH